MLAPNGFRRARGGGRGAERGSLAPLRALRMVLRAAWDAAGSSDDGGEEEEAVCRLCLCGTEAGRLLSPCRCRGTQGLVHLACLNRWRATSAEAAARCTTCGEAYATRRTRLAAYLTLPWLPQAAAWVLLGAAVLAASVLSSLLYARGDAAAPFYRLVGWLPPWRRRLMECALLRPLGWLSVRAWTCSGWRAVSPALDAAVAGGSHVGAMAFCHAAYTQVRDARNFGDTRYLVHLAALYAATFHNAGWRFWRVGVVLGLVALWRRYKESALQGARSLLVRWGEQLLEPDRMVGQDPLNSAAPDGDDELRALVGDIARTLARDAREWATDAAMDLRCSARRLYFCAADGLDALRGYRPIRLERRL